MKDYRKINKSEETTDVAIHEEHHLDICMGDKEIYISCCLYLPTHSYVKKKNVQLL